MMMIIQRLADSANARLHARRRGIAAACRARVGTCPLVHAGPRAASPSKALNIGPPACPRRHRAANETQLRAGRVTQPGMLQPFRKEDARKATRLERNDGSTVTASGLGLNSHYTHLGVHTARCVPRRIACVRTYRRMRERWCLAHIRRPPGQLEAPTSSCQL